MAKYRQIHLQIWRDSTFQNYSSQEKLLFIYLITNDLTNESGIYEVSEKTISNETGIPLSRVGQLLGKGLPTVSQPIANGLRNVSYDFDNHLVFIHHYRKYQNTGGKPSLIFKCIQDEYNKYKNSRLWELFFQLYPEYAGLKANPLPTHCQPIANPLSTVTVNDNDNVNDNGNYNDNDKKDLIKDVNVSEKKCELKDVVENSANRIKLSFVKYFKGLPYPFRSKEAERIKEHQLLDVKLYALLMRTRGDPEPFIQHMEQVSDNGKDIGSISYFLSGYQGGASVWDKLCDQLVFDEHSKIKEEFKRAIDENKALKLIAQSLVETEQPVWVQKAIGEYKKIVQKYEMTTDFTEKQLLRDQVLTMKKKLGL